MQRHAELFDVPDRAELHRLEARIPGDRIAPDATVWELVPLSSEAAGVPSLPEVEQLEHDRAA